MCRAPSSISAPWDSLRGQFFIQCVVVVCVSVQTSCSCASLFHTVVCVADDRRPRGACKLRLERGARASGLFANGRFIHAKLLLSGCGLAFSFNAPRDSQHSGQFCIQTIVHLCFVSFCSSFLLLDVFELMSAVDWCCLLLLGVGFVIDFALFL